VTEGVIDCHAWHVNLLLSLLSLFVGLKGSEIDRQTGHETRERKEKMSGGRRMAMAQERIQDEGASVTRSQSWVSMSMCFCLSMVTRERGTRGWLVE